MKKLFVPIKKSQENNCAGVFFNKVSGLQPYLKRDFDEKSWTKQCKQILKIKQE